MSTARITIDTDFRIGAVDPRLFGSFVEHLGRCVYGGIYEPDHPTADDSGFRGDVLALVRELNVPLVQMNALLGFVADALTNTILSLGLERALEVRTLRAFNKLLWLQNDLINRHYQKAIVPATKSRCIA